MRFFKERSREDREGDAKIAMIIIMSALKGKLCDHGVVFVARFA